MSTKRKRKGSDRSVPPFKKKKLNNGLPFGWEKRKDARGRVYYANTIEETTQWETPTEPALPPPLSKRETIVGWKLDPSCLYRADLKYGVIYFYIGETAFFSLPLVLFQQMTQCYESKLYHNHFSLRADTRYEISVPAPDSVAKYFLNFLAKIQEVVSEPVDQEFSIEYLAPCEEDSVLDEQLDDAETSENDEEQDEGSSADQSRAIPCVHFKPVKQQPRMFKNMKVETLGAECYGGRIVAFFANNVAFHTFSIDQLAGNMFVTPYSGRVVFAYLEGTRWEVEVPGPPSHTSKFIDLFRLVKERIYQEPDGYWAVTVDVA